MQAATANAKGEAGEKQHIRYQEYAIMTQQDLRDISLILSAAVLQRMNAGIWSCARNYVLPIN